MTHPISDRLRPAGIVRRDLAITTEHVTSFEAIARSVGDGVASGWVTLTDRVVALMDTVPPQGPWLSADLVRGDVTWQVRHSSNGWSVYRYESTPGTSYEVERVEVLADTRDGRERVALYDVYWSRQPLPLALREPDVDIEPWAVTVAIFRGWA